MLRNKFVFYQKEKEKRNMRKTKRVIAIILSAVAVLGATIPAQAASSDVNIEIKKKQLDRFINFNFTFS